MGTEPPPCEFAAHGFVPAGSLLAELPSRLAAVAAHMVEIDVIQHAGELVLAHSPEEATRNSLLRFDDVLGVLTEHLPDGVRLNVDLKATGYEKDVVWSLDHFGLIDRSLISSMELDSLLTIRGLSAAARLGWSVPKASRDYMRNPLTRPAAYAALAYYRRVLPGRTMRQVLRGSVDAVMAHWGVVTPTLCEMLELSGAELYVWTVDDPARLARLKELGATRFITNTPNIFMGDATMQVRRPG